MSKEEVNTKELVFLTPFVSCEWAVFLLQPFDVFHHFVHVDGIHIVIQAQDLRMRYFKIQNSNQKHKGCRVFNLELGNTWILYHIMGLWIIFDFGCGYIAIWHTNLVIKST